jgi:hypothetical protein
VLADNSKALVCRLHHTHTRTRTHTQTHSHPPSVSLQRSSGVWRVAGDGHGRCMQPVHAGEKMHPAQATCSMDGHAAWSACLPPLVACHRLEHLLAAAFAQDCTILCGRACVLRDDLADLADRILRNMQQR